MNQTYQAFDNYQLKLKAWLSLVLPGFQGMPGYNLPRKSGNSGLDLKILTRNTWLVWYHQAFLVGLVEIFLLKSLVSLVYTGFSGKSGLRFSPQKLGKLCLTRVSWKAWLKSPT